MGLLPCLLRSATSFMQLMATFSDSNSLTSLSSLKPLPHLLRWSKNSESVNEKRSGENIHNPLCDHEQLGVSVMKDKKACLEYLSWIEQVLMLTMSLITVTNALPALAENGLVALLISVVKLPPVSIPSSTEDSLLWQVSLRRAYVTALLIQLLEQTVGSHTASMTMFNEVKGFQYSLNRLADELDELDIASHLKTLRETESERVSPSTSRSNGIEMMEVVVEEEVSKLIEDAELNSVESRQRTGSNSFDAAIPRPEDKTGGSDEVNGQQQLVVTLKKPQDISAASTIMIHSLFALCTFFLQQSTQGKILREKLFSNILTKVFSNMGVLSPSISASCFILFSDVINNDPSLLSHFIGNGVAESCVHASIAFNVVRIKI